MYGAVRRARTRDTDRALVVEERDPGASYQSGRRPALPPRIRRVDIAASKITGAVVIARTALHDGNTVFLAEAGRLAKRQVQVARFRHDEAILSGGLQRGYKLVVSFLSAPVVGMQLRASKLNHLSSRLTLLR